MPRTAVAAMLLSLWTISASADTWVVTSRAYSGYGTLGWAIVQANANPDEDLITFAPQTAVKSILPTGLLPPLTDGGTTIDGDLDDDGDPDILIDGRNLTTGSCLRIVHTEKPGCTIIGLAIINYPDTAISIENSRNNTIQGCNLGVNRVGDGARRNGNHDIKIVNSHYDTIGGAAPTARNVFGTGKGFQRAAIYIEDSTYTRIWGNYFGPTRDGGSLLPDVNRGISIDGLSDGKIGGDAAGEGNVFAGSDIGIDMTGASPRNQIVGNLCGLAPDGSTAWPMTVACLTLDGTSNYNTIGGTTKGSRNVFVSDSNGIVMAGRAAQNRVRGNYFGTNAEGTGKRPIRIGVLIVGGARAQIIGGAKARAGNYFCSSHGDRPVAVFFAAGDGSTVQNNHFGIRPNGRDGFGLAMGVTVENTEVDIIGNEFAGTSEGAVFASQSAALARVLGNTFRDCHAGVIAGQSGQCFLGSLSNSAADDDGGNTFADSNTWFIRNLTANRVRAEGNTFPSTSRTAINAKIEDSKDDPALGKVDFDPLAGGVIPTGGTVAIAGADALPTSTGAEIVFSMTEAASVNVSIVNIAGRPIAMVARDSALGAGTQRLIWSGRGSAGTAAPGGMYLVRISARDSQGRQAQAIAPLQLRR